MVSALCSPRCAQRAATPFVNTPLAVRRPPPPAWHRNLSASRQRARRALRGAGPPLTDEDRERVAHLKGLLEHRGSSPPGQLPDYSMPKWQEQDGGKKGQQGPTGKGRGDQPSRSASGASSGPWSQGRWSSWSGGASRSVDVSNGYENWTCSKCGTINWTVGKVATVAASADT